MSNLQALDIIKLIIPVILIQLALQIYAIVDITRKKKTRNLSMVAWILIVILGEIIGSVAYLLFGRAED